MQPRRSHGAAIALLSGILLAAAPAQTPDPIPPPSASAEETPLPPRLTSEWLSRYEQSWGSEGVYILELDTPDPDPELRSRLNLQRLQMATIALWELKGGETEPTFTAFAEAGLTPEILPRTPPEEKHAWNPELRSWESSFGLRHQLAFGAARTVVAHDEWRREVLFPKDLTRHRWERLRADRRTPSVLLRELDAREMLLDFWESDEALAAWNCQRNLDRVAEALEVLSLQRGLDRGAEVTIQDVAGTGFLDTMEACPSGGKYAVSAVGAPPTCSHGNAHVWNDRAAIDRLRQQHVERLLQTKPDHPPYLALLARTQPPETAVTTINRAIEQWNDVPVLRVERLAHLARAGTVEPMAEDLNYLLARCPAGPILEEIEMATSLGGLREDRALRVEVAQLLADVRPDLLGPQLRAIEVLTRVGNIAEARRIHDRLIMNNPGYANLLTPPE